MEFATCNRDGRISPVADVDTVNSFGFVVDSVVAVVAAVVPQVNWLPNNWMSFRHTWSWLSLYEILWVIFV